ncbi:uncharacterized protein [Antedon mediterranea]|uniref:uncharacterized protein n=1 Tax=Antedon mediterranea TaxID=105859 RepID=UPI003AF5802F
MVQILKPIVCPLEDEQNVNEESLGPIFLKDEITKGIKRQHERKAEGIDGIPAEMLKQLGEVATLELTKLSNKIYTQGKWPADFTKSVVIPLEKKVNTQRCDEHRTISLIPHNLR